MSRFNDDGDWDYGRWSLWEQATTKALEGRRGQAALADLEAALLALPEHRLIESHLAHEGEVCAVGALVLHNRCAAGESRAAVMADLEQIDRSVWDDAGYASDVTASTGKRYGRMAYAMAWRIAELNDEDFRGVSPEERFTRVLAWVRQALGRPEALSPAQA